MKKSVLTSLIAASALFTGVAFAGSYTADAGYTAADTSAMAGSENGFLQGLYAGVGINHTTQDKASVTTDGTTTSDLDTTNNGYGLLVGKHVNDMFALELGYNSYGKNTFTDSTGATTNDYYQMWSSTVMAVANSAAYCGVSAHAKGGVGYISEKSKVESTDTVSANATGSLVFGVGLEYQIQQFAVSLDWTRFQANNNNGAAADLYAPDEYSLNLIYNFA